MANKYSKTYTSFSGCDMVASIDINLGSSKNKDGSYGQNKITYVVGELQTVSYSIHMDKSPVRSIGSVNAKDYVMGPRTIAGSLVFAMFDRHIVQSILKKAQEAAGASDKGQLVIMDELPPFNLTISMANEYGNKARLAIYGIRIINEGNVMSVNDVYTENTYQFVATDIEYLSDVQGSSASYQSKAASYYSEKTVGISLSSGAKPVPADTASNEESKIDVSHTGSGIAISDEKDNEDISDVIFKSENDSYVTPKLSKTTYTKLRY